MTREELERRVCRVRQELEEAAGDRWPVPKLIAVTKTHSAEEILPLKEIAPLEGIRVRGLMAVMPLTDDREYLDGLFAKTRELFDRLRDKGLSGIEMEELSMGMSGDYQIAAAHGATMVRVGSAIFGPRG